MTQFIAQFVLTPLVATTLSHIAVVMVTDTLPIFAIYWTRRHYWLVTCHCVGTNWFVDTIRAGKIKLVILFLFLRSFLVFGTVQITPGLLLLHQIQGQVKVFLLVLNLMWF